MMPETADMIEKIAVNILTALYQPFGFSVLLSVFALFFYLYAYNPVGAGKGWKAAVRAWITAFRTSPLFRKLFLLAFVISLILFRTLLNRDLWMNPLSDIMGGWSIWETVNGERQLTTECIENVIMLIPFTALLMWTMGEKIVKRFCFKNIVLKSAETAFCFSLTIELLQLLLRLGTFQFSDIFYNTLGGMCGGVIYWVWWNLHREKT